MGRLLPNRPFVKVAALGAALLLPGVSSSRTAGPFQVLEERQETVAQLVAQPGQPEGAARAMSVAEPTDERDLLYSPFDAPTTSATSATSATSMVATSSAAGGTSEEGGPRRASRVVIISEDGLRGNALQEMRLPWHEALYERGAYSWKAQTVRPASTLPSHAAMLSGFDVKEHGLSWNRWKPDKGYIKVPTIFETAEALGHKTAMFVGKPKLRHLARPGTVRVFERPGFYCKKVAREAADYLVREQPMITFVHFSNPDAAGHRDGWRSSKYRRAVRECDRCLGVLIQALEKAGLAEDTLIIVSSDHGGHGHTHGMRQSDRLIPWIAHGPGVRNGHHLQSAISTLDTAATAMYALGLPLAAEATGRPITEIYAQD